MDEADEKLYKISDLDEADYRFEIQWLSYTDSQDTTTDISDLAADNDFLDNIINLTSYTNDDLAAVIATDFAIEDNTTITNIKSILESETPDDIYQGLTFNGAPLYVSSIDDREAHDEIYIRAISVIASENESNRSEAITKISNFVNSSRVDAGLSEGGASTKLIFERFSQKAKANKNALNNMFAEGSTAEFSAEELARLQEIDKMVSGASKDELGEAVSKFSTDIAATGSVLTIQRTKADGTPLTETIDGVEVRRGFY